MIAITLHTTALLFRTCTAEISDGILLHTLHDMHSFRDKYSASLILLDRVNPELQDAVGFMDFIPRLRSMGEKALAAQVDTQRADLVKLVEGRIRINPDVIPGQSTSTLAFNNEEGATALMRELDALKGQWFGVLQDAVYERVMGFLLEYVLRAAMKPVLEAGAFFIMITSTD
jgi:hypothetical protein